MLLGVNGSRSGVVSKAGSAGIGALAAAGGAQPFAVDDAATAVAWSGGDQPAQGQASTGALAYPGGVAFTTAAPVAGATANLTLLLGSSGGAVGNVTASVVGVDGASKTITVGAGAAVLSLQYRNGPLAVRYGSSAGTGACSPSATKAARWACVLPATLLGAGTIPLSGQGVQDWAHWGVASSQPTLRPPWGTEKMKGGLGVLNPVVTDPSGPALKSFSNNAASFSWSDGTPVASSAGFVSGVFTVRGTFGLNIPTPSGAPGASGLAPASQKLTLFLGVYNSTGKLTVTDAAKVSHVVRVNNRGNVNSPNVQIPIIFCGALSITWARDDESNEGNVTWQAAKLETHNGPPSGAVTVQAIVLDLGKAGGEPDSGFERAPLPAGSSPVPA